MGSTGYNTPQGRVVVEEPLVGGGDAGGEIDARCPSGGGEAGGVKDFAGGAVGFGGVKHEFRFGVHDVTDLFGEGADGDVAAGADVDVGIIGVVIHQMHTCVSEVIHM